MEASFVVSSSVSKTLFNLKELLLYGDTRNRTTVSETLLGGVRCDFVRVGLFMARSRNDLLS